MITPGGSFASIAMLMGLAAGGGGAPGLHLPRIPEAHTCPKCGKKTRQKYCDDGHAIVRVRPKEKK